MKRILMMLMLSASIAASAQTAMIKGGSRSAGTVFGSIRMPALQSMHIDMDGNNNILFETAEAFDQGKVLPRFFSATLVSNVPYMVNVMTSSASFNMESGQGQLIPVSIMRIRNSQTGTFMPLSVRSQPLLISTSDKLRSVHHFDLEVNPGWNYPGGHYNVSVVFTLTPQ